MNVNGNYSNNNSTPNFKMNLCASSDVLERIGREEFNKLATTFNQYTAELAGDVLLKHHSKCKVPPKGKMHDKLVISALYSNPNTGEELGESCKEAAFYIDELKEGIFTSYNNIVENIVVYLADRFAQTQARNATKYDSNNRFAVLFKKLTGEEINID